MYKPSRKEQKEMLQLFKDFKISLEEIIGSLTFESKNAMDMFRRGTILAKLDRYEEERQNARERA